jgi:hypothetical protein
MILDENNSATYPQGLLKESYGVFCMVQHVDEYDGVKSGISIRYGTAIKGFYRNPGAVSDMDVDSLERKIGPLLHNQLGDKPVTTPYVQYPRVLGNQICQMGTQYPGTAPSDISFVDEFGDPHFLFLRRSHANNEVKQIRCAPFKATL